MDFCNRAIGIFELLGNILNIFKLLIPLIIIVYATFDFAKALTSKEEKENIKSAKRVIFRILSALLIFFLPSIINYAFSLIGVEKSDCLKCMLDTPVCESLRKDSNSQDSNSQTQNPQSNVNNNNCTINDPSCISNAIFNN